MTIVVLKPARKISVIKYKTEQITPSLAENSMLFHTLNPLKYINPYTESIQVKQKEIWQGFPCIWLNVWDILNTGTISNKCTGILKSQGKFCLPLSQKVCTSMSKKNLADKNVLNLQVRFLAQLINTEKSSPLHRKVCLCLLCHLARYIWFTCRTWWQHLDEVKCVIWFTQRNAKASVLSIHQQHPPAKSR